MRLIKNIKHFLAIRIYVISYIFPIKKNLWVFGKWEGQLYSDNSKYLYEYVVKNHPEIEAVWITRNLDIVKTLKKRKFNCVKRQSWKGIWYSMRAEAAFVTCFAYADISPLINRNHTKVIELWHGVGAKAMKPESLSKAGRDRYGSYYWIATSEKYIDVLHEATGTPKSKFLITGYPRNDSFVNKIDNPMVFDILSHKWADKYIIYMPTHRNFGKDSVSVEEFHYVNSVLKKNNIVMVYKPNFNELRNVLGFEDSFTNIIIAKDSDIWADAYSYLHYFDLLISDYSSISYDFLCAKKPIVQYVYDIHRYKEVDFGLCNYFESLPLGPFCFSWVETMDQVVKLLNEDTWIERREICRKTFHPFDDGKNSERVFNAVVQLLQIKK